MSEPIFIFGCGGHAREVAQLAETIGRRPVLVARDVRELEKWIGSWDIILESDAVKKDNGDFAVGIGDNHARARVACTYPHLRFPTLIHPDTSFATGQRALVEAEHGTVVFAGVRMMANVAVGRFCTFNLNVTVSHDCAIGNFVNISPGANVAGNVQIGNGAWIGIGAAINQGTDLEKLKIGENTVIGSGSVVLYACDPNSVYAGNPVRKIR